MKRMDRDDDLDRSQELVAGLAAAETMRNAVQAVHEKEDGAKKEDEKLSVYWRVFGGTVLSIIALAAVTLFNNLFGSIGELRSELNKEREARADLVKKDDFHARVTSQYERIRAAEGMQTTLSALKSEHEGIKETVKANAAAVEGVKKETAAFDALRERIAAVESIKKDLASLDVAKEKLASLAADMKSQHDEFTKLNQEVSQNRIADLERKTLRDSQAKQFEESIKELTKEMQDVREKLARLEGQQPTPTPAPKAKTASRTKPEPEVAPMPGVVPASGTKE